jgi:hypothetical protein
MIGRRALRVVRLDVPYRLMVVTRTNVMSQKISEIVARYGRETRTQNAQKKKVSRRMNFVKPSRSNSRFSKQVTPFKTKLMMASEARNVVGNTSRVGK